jgi:hypothetical protein
MENNFDFNYDMSYKHAKSQYEVLFIICYTKIIKFDYFFGSKM